MINCYKILEVQNFSDEKTIQRAYRTLAKKYHPDVNKSQDTSELFIIIAKAYETLNTPSAKNIHDNVLKDALLWESDAAYKKQFQQPKQRGLSEEKRKAWSYQKAKKEIETFEKENAFLPYSLRIATGALFAIFALQLLYSNYFIDLNSNELPMLVLGYGLFIVSAVSILAHVYKKLRVDVLLKRAKLSYDRFSFGLFLAILIIGPSSVLGLNSYRKVYHLNHYPALTTAHINEITGDGDVVFSYKPMGDEHEFMKRMTLTEGSIYNTVEGWIIIRYSLADPRIVELVVQSE